MPAPQKYAREALERDHDRRRSLGETQEEIAKDIVPGGMPVGTLRNILYQVRKKRGQKSLPQEPPMSVDETPVEVLDGQMDLEASDTVPDDPVSLSTIADIVPVNSATSEHLSAVEVQTLEHYERIIAQGIKTFVEVGHALVIIRDERLYRESYGTFEDYLRQRWDLSRPYAYQLIDAAQVVDAVSATADIVPVNEAQARPLTRLAPEQQAEVWQEAVKTAPAGKVTAKHVQETVKRAKATGHAPSKLTSTKPFDVQSIETKMTDLYMDWLRHCETDDALETAQFFLNTLSDLAQGRAMLLHRQ